MIFPKRLQFSWRDRFSRLLRILHEWPWLDTLKTLRQRFREDRLGMTASSLTFTTIIALVPFFTVSLALFSAFPMFGKFQMALEKYFIQTLVPDSIAKPVLRALTQFATNANRLGTLGLILLVVTALALMLTIDRTLNSIWRVRTRRPIAQRVLVYWAAVTLGPLLLGVSLSTTSYALYASRGIVDLPGGVGFLLNLVEFALTAGAVTGLFRYVPNTYVRWPHALAGGVFVAGAFEVAKALLAWYVKQVPTYSAVYGTFATVPIFLVWLYLSWVIVLLGAVIAAYAPSLQMQVVRRPATPGHVFLLTVTLLRELQAARLQGIRGLSASALSERLRTDPLQIEPILDDLVMLDWVGRLEEEGGARYVLLVEPQTTTAQPLLAQALLDPSPTLRGFWHRAGFAEMTLADLLAP